MRAVVQRVSRAKVVVEDEVVGAIEQGLLVLLGITHDDTTKQAQWLAEKLSTLRLFNDADDKMNASLADVDGSMLIVSQFTLFGDARKGRRPSFLGAAPPEIAIPLYEEFLAHVKSLGIPTQTGKFGAMMQVELTNDGPVTLIVETPPAT